MVLSGSQRSSVVFKGFQGGFSVVLISSLVLMWLSVVLEGSLKFSGVLTSSKWFSVVLKGSQWFLVVLSSSQEFSEVLSGSQVFSGVLSCSKEFSVVLSGS